ncbi:MAG: rRNA pseudouridine synthase [Clostridiales bacterium]|nr:rRNA pseudouridine synthase [Clostridiales bacterium]
MRLQKYMAMSGVASRRKSEELIKEGRVSVNGNIIREMGVEVSDNDIVCFDGKPIRQEMRKRYIMLNKPVGYMTTMSDPQGRDTVAKLVSEISERVYPVGRLDYETEGMLLMTNDGELANRLTHPRYEIEKTYYARIGGTLSEDDVRQMTSGMTLPDGHKAAPAKVKVLERAGSTTLVEVTVHEGHNRIIRQMFEKLDKNLLGLRRERIGQLSLGGLPMGRWKHLSPGEVKYLLHITGLDVER